MPATVKVRVLAGRDLPIMDRASETADAFVEVKFGQTVYKTEIYPKSLSPLWNSDWFTFEADDEELQDDCVQFRVMDYDTYSANDAIGRVYLDLSPLLSRRDGPAQIGGWLPIYDTMHGIRGELHVCVKIDLFTDINRFRQSSCGVEVFSTPGVPSGYQLIMVHGFVEELVANSDPEYQWIDKIRTPRASNEARQALFAKLAGALIRIIGRKVLEMGGNAVIGYRHSFDMEGGTGIVVRGVGTAVTLEKLEGYHVGILSPSSPTPIQLWQVPLAEAEQVGNTTLDSSVVPEEVGVSIPKPMAVEKVRASHESSTSNEDLPNNTKFIVVDRQSPKSSIGALTVVNAVPKKSSPFRQPLIVGPSMDFIEYPFVTMHVFPQNFITNLGGVVCARSVKLLKNIESPTEPETRDAWWLELRNEIRSHMKALGCNAVIGYQEDCCIFRDLCLLSAYGTAAIFDCPSPNHPPPPMSAPVTEDMIAKVAEKSIKVDKSLKVDTLLANRFFSMRTVSTPGDYGLSNNIATCLPCHIPYSENGIPFPVKLSVCQICENAKVPNILLTTIDFLSDLDVNDDFQLIQARIVRLKQDLSSEALAKDVSDFLPFVEHQLHTELVGKLRLMGKNAVFGLRMNITVGESHLIALATGTAVSLSALTVPPTADLDESHRQTASKAFDHLSQLAFHRKVKSSEKVSQNNDSKHTTPEQQHHVYGNSNENGHMKRNLDLAWDKDAILAELESIDSAISIDPKPTEGFSCCNLFAVPQVFLKDVRNLNHLQLFVRVGRCNLNEAAQLNNKNLSNKINWLLKSTFYKFRKLKPLCLANVSFSLDLPESDEILIAIVGMALTSNVDYPHAAKISNELMAASSCNWAAAKRNRQVSGGSTGGGSTEENVFHLDTSTHSLNIRHDSLSHSCPSAFFRKRHFSLAEETKATKSRQIFITPLLHPSHSLISNYLGHYDFFFIRETTSLREVGGLDAFLHSALTEILYVVQAHVAAYGGHGMTSFQFAKTELLQNSNRNQAQCLVAVAGDIVTTIGIGANAIVSV